MISIILEVDKIAQENEKVRISFDKSFLTPDDVSVVTSVKVKPDAALSFITLPNPTETQGWYLDWIYSTAGNYTYTVEITAGLTVATKSGTISVKTSVEEKLFSEDAYLVPQESDIMKWVPQGRSTWNIIHRRVKERIMEELDKSRIYNPDGTKITDAQILYVSEFKNWAIYMALAMIFQGISNNKEDVFIDKRKYYESKELEYKEYCLNFLRLDMNKNGTDEPAEDYVDGRSTIALKR